MKIMILTVMAMYAVISCDQHKIGVTEAGRNKGSFTGDAKFKNIYKKNEKFFVVLDPLEVNYDSPQNNGDLKIKVFNKTEEALEFEVPRNAEILNEHCGGITPEQLVSQKSKLLKLQRIGFTANVGKIIQINTGCWQ